MNKAYVLISTNTGINNPFRRKFCKITRGNNNDIEVEPSKATLFLMLKGLRIVFYVNIIV